MKTKTRKRKARAKTRSRSTSTSSAAVSRPRRPYASDPVVEISKHQGRYTALGYRSSRVGTDEGRSGATGSSDRHMQFDRIKLVAQAREFQNDNGLFAGMVERASSYVVGTGFKLQASTKDKDWNQDTEARWKEFWESPEIRGLLSGPEVEAMVCSELMTVGDTGVNMTKTGLLQMIESEQISRRGKFLDGIEKDEVGRPIRFHISEYDERGNLSARSTQIEPQHFLFISRQIRPSATRAVPPLQASFAMLHRIDDVCNAEALAWQLLSRLALSISQEDGPLAAEQISKDDPDKAGDDTTGHASTRITEFDWGVIFHGKPGEKVSGIERNLPGKDFPASLRMFLRLLGLPLGLPLEIVLLDWTKSNYSQSRAVLLQAYVTFRRWQMIIERKFMSPVYKWWLRREMEANRIKKPKGTDGAFAHTFIKPSFPWIDQLKEAQANGEKIDRGFCTHAEVLKSLNIERQDLVEAREQEIKDAIERAKRLSADTGVAIPWQHFAGFLPPDTAPVTPRRKDTSPPPRRREEEDEEDDE